MNKLLLLSILLSCQSALAQPYQLPLQNGSIPLPYYQYMIPHSYSGDYIDTPTDERARADDPQERIQTVFTPYDNGNAEYYVLELIRYAKKSIHMCAYGFTDSQICDALCQMKYKGIDVQIVMDKTEANGVHQAPLVAQMQAQGIPVYIGKSAVKNQLIHAKFIVVDGKVVEDGSWNYSPSASQQDNFVNIIYSDERAKMFEDFFTKIKNHIQEVKNNGN